MKALLITGPPGSGKSPLGDFLEKKFPSGKKIWHFDFGRQLRLLLKSASAVRAGDSTGLPGKKTTEQPADPETMSAATCFSSQEIKRIKRSVETARLFEETDRELVRKILRYFLKINDVGEQDLLVLNGLPRDRTQISWLGDLLSIALVISLECPEDVAIRRILSNLDGERQGRLDDRLEVIIRRYRLYQEKNEPLLDYLKQAGIPVIKLSVSRETRPEMLWQQLENSPHFLALF